MDNLPEKIGGCRIVAKIGQGGMGAVYRARHETLSREVAIKVLPPAFTQNPEYVQRFLREARAAAQLQHNNVVQVYDAGEQSGQYYITMEFVDGTSLAHRLLNEGQLSEQEALGYLVQSARGLAAAHARGLIHRDIKPENLLINKENTLKIADFGLVTASASDSAGLTQDGAMLGTPLYMSPEQGEGQVADSRSDLYSLGVTFFRAITGSTPFNAPSPIGIIYKHKYEETPDPKTLKPGLAPATAQLLLKLMAKKPDERFQSADEVARTAEELLSQMQTGQVPAQLPAVAPGPPPVSPSSAMPAVADSAAFAPTVTPVRGEPGVATVMPQRVSAVATPPVPGGTPSSVHAGTPPPAPGQQPIAPPPPGQVFTPVPQQGMGSSPAYAPTPGMAAQAALTPAPAPQPKSRAGLVAVCAIVLLAMLGGGGFLGYQYYRSQQVAQAKQEAEGMRTRGEYDQAITHLETAFGEHPEAPDLVTLRDSIEAQKVNELVDGFRKQATQCRLDKNYSGEAKAYEDAENLLAQHKGLAGVKQDATLASSRKRAEDLHQFTLFMAEGKAAEDEKRYDAAEKAYQEAVKFETMGEGKAQQAATRAKFKGLVAQAEAMETSRDYPQALTLLEQAAKLNVQDVTRLKDRVNKAMNYERHLTDALKMQESGDLRGAAETFAKAMRYAASDEEADRLRERADALGVEANFKDQVTAGERAMAERRWKEAQAAWAKALKIKPNHQQATALLKRCESNELADQALSLQKQNDFAGALSKLQAAQQADPSNESVTAAISAISEKLQAIRSMEVNARKAEAAGEWIQAQTMWQALAKQDPNNSAKYQQRATNAKFEEFMAKSKDSLPQNDLEAALKHAKAAQPYDSTGGQRAQAQIQSIQRKIQAVAEAKKQAALAQQRQAATQAALSRANTFASQGQFEEASAVINSAFQADPGNAQLNQMRSNITAVAAVQGSYKRLEGYRQDAESAIQNAYNADDDKKIRAELERVKAWQQPLIQGRAAAGAAWQTQRFEDLSAQAEAAKTLARQMAQQFSNQAAIFDGRAASAAKPKANIGGGIGGFRIGGRRLGGFGGNVGASADVGDNQKKAGIFRGTADSLRRCSQDCRNLAN